VHQQVNFNPLKVIFPTTKILHKENFDLISANLCRYNPFGYINGLSLYPLKAKILMLIEEPLLAFDHIFLFVFNAFIGFSFEIPDA